MRFSVICELTTLGNLRPLTTSLPSHSQPFPNHLMMKCLLNNYCVLHTICFDMLHDSVQKNVILTLTPPIPIPTNYSRVKLLVNSSSGLHVIQFDMLYDHIPIKCKFEPHATPTTQEQNFKLIPILFFVPLDLTYYMAIF